MQILGAFTPLIPAVLSPYTGTGANKINRLLTHLFLALIGAVFLIISAKVQIPFYPVPMTMQTLVVLMIGMSYGAPLAASTVFLYLFQGAIGLPVFATGGGLAYMMGPTGGYLVGFFFSAILLGLLASNGWGKTWQTTAVAMILGVGVIFAIGVSWLAFFVGFEAAIITGFLPFIYADFLKIIIASFIMPAAWSVVDRFLK
jgi:biotin transport system substrate-specific component